MMVTKKPALQPAGNLCEILVAFPTAFINQQSRETDNLTHYVSC